MKNKGITTGSITITGTCPSNIEPLFQYAQPSSNGSQGAYVERTLCPECGKGCRMIVEIDGVVTKHSCCCCKKPFATT